MIADLSHISGPVFGFAAIMSEPAWRFQRQTGSNHHAWVRDEMADIDVPRDAVLVTRAEARASGAKSYFTGLPCSRGHMSHRATLSGGCRRCAVERVAKWRVNEPRKAAILRFKEKVSKWKPVEMSARDMARLSGQSFYSAGAACRKGHASPRRVCDGKCVQCSRDQAKARYAADRAQNGIKQKDARLRRRADFLVHVSLAKLDGTGKALREQFSTRKEAFSAGARFYCTGKPCPYGHMSHRYTESAACSQCTVDRFQIWRIKNPEAARELRRKWARENADKKREQTKASARRNRDRIEEARRAYCMRNKDKIRIRNAAWRLRNKDRQAETSRAWLIANREQARSNVRKRRAMRLAVGGVHTATDIREIFAMQRGRCGYCKGSVRNGYHVDHIKPLILGGSNDRRNLQILCASCNHRKSGFDPIEFARRNGRLV